MPPDVIIWIAGGVFIAGVILAIIFSVRAERRKEARLHEERQAAAAATGFVRAEDARAACPDWNTSQLGGGKSNLVVAYIKATQPGERVIALLQHQYVVSTGKSQHTVRHRLAVTPVFAQWPYLRLSPENLFTRLASWLGFRDLEVEDQQFNDRWRIKTKDRGFAELLLCPAVQELLRDGPNKRVWLIENGYLNLIESGQLRGEDFETLPRALQELINAIPEELEVWMPETDGPA